jgi:DNA-directed RNA polymerase specialized sigma24 family protein
MDDRYIVSAMRGSALATLAGLAGAYDKYAAPLYSYCCWTLGDPVAAAEAVRDTFRFAMTDLPAIRDPELLRAHLYAVARGECQRQPAATAAGAGAVDSDSDSGSASGSGRYPSADDRPADLRGLIIDTLAGLDSAEREVAELLFRHGLSHTDLALVLSMPRRRASALAAHVQGYLEQSLAVPIVAYAGARTCPELSELLPGWDGQVTVWTTGLVERHIEECLTCESLRYQAFHPAIVYALESRADLPADLRGQVIGLLVDSQGPERTARGETSAPNPSHARLGALLAVAAILIWVIVAVIVTLMTILSSHSAHGGTTDRTGWSLATNTLIEVRSANSFIPI